MTIYYCDFHSDYVKGVYESVDDFLNVHQRYRTNQDVRTALLKHGYVLLFEDNDEIYNYLVVVNDKNIS